MAAASAALQADIGRTPKDDDKGETVKIQAEMKEFKGVLSKVLSAVKLVVTHSPSGTVFTEEELKEAGREPAKEGGPAGQLDKIDGDMLDKVAAAFFAGRAKLAASLDASELAKKEYNNTLQYVLKLEKSQGQLQQTIRLYTESVKKFSDAKASMMKELQRAGLEADRLTGNAGGYEAASRLIGESSAFLAQVDVTLQHGKQEQNQKDKVEGRQTAIQDWTQGDVGTQISATPATAAQKAGNKMVDPAGIRWYSWIPTPAYKKRAGLDKSGKGEIATNHVNAASLAAKGELQQQTAAGTGGANETVALLLADLTSKKTSVGEMRSQLLNAMGLFGNAV